eukprot:TRINITY_DN6866_c0_g2_i1.p1 TRINITY_DN6866_c0_g2~~TRINITY_DN6866_c0_g2_i1.p1  ORF type:complete len:339 (+),score=103.37 TRINITY_DN6866_c0_g2_i1:86-1102(+)
MLSRGGRSAAAAARHGAGRRAVRGARRNYRIAVLGAAGGIGQPLALLLKRNPMVTDLTLYDIVNTPGVAADLSHICSPARVTGFLGDDLPKALQERDIVVIPAGVPRKPGMTRDDLFKTNAGIVKSLAHACATHCPKAHLAVISNPVNSTVPICSEVYKQLGVHDPGRILGVCTLDTVRARTFVAERKGLDVRQVDVNVIGGHSGATIVPLLSQVQGVEFTQEEVEQLTHRIQFGGDEVVKAKAGAGSATLSMADAGVRFVDSLLRALNGEAGVVECAYVEHAVDGVPFFSSPVELGPEGVKNVREIGPMSEYEQGLYAECLKQLQANIEAGVNFAQA